MTNINSNMKTATFLFLIIMIFSEVESFFQKTNVEGLKQDILTLSRKVNRGLTETAEDRSKIEDLFEQIEKKAKKKATLSNPAVNGNWSLEYTTSDNILGRGKVGKKIAPIVQKIDTINLKAENSEVIQYFGFFNVPAKVTADLSPMTSSKAAVQFKKFSIGPISFKAPASFQGELDITYVDNDFRLTRGDLGNIFILTKLSEL